jgi:hypothetical protein
MDSHGQRKNGRNFRGETLLPLLVGTRKSARALRRGEK